MEQHSLAYRSGVSRSNPLTITMHPLSPSSLKALLASAAPVVQQVTGCPRVVVLATSTTLSLLALWAAVEWTRTYVAMQRAERRELERRTFGSSTVPHGTR